MRQVFSSAIAVIATMAVLGCGKAQDEAPVNAKDAPITAKAMPEATVAQASIGAPGESVVAEFSKRVKEYIALRDQLGGTLKNPPDKATPSQIDAHQRALLALVAKSRANAKRGDLFIPEMQTYIRGLMRRVLAGPDGPRIRASLMDENPMGVQLEVNARYPDTIPLSTMPPDILAALPRLPEEIEYRFVGNRLILLDVRSHLIVDFVDSTFDV